jgi:uncharacterized protein YegP (UPF0339 family)
MGQARNCTEAVVGNSYAANLLAAMASELRFDVYQDARREWRWRSWSGSRIVGDSAEGYINRSGCVRMAQKHGYRGN